MTGRRRPLTPAEREHLTDLGAQRARTRNDADDAVAARNDELRRLYLDGVGPTALAACIPGEPDPTFSMHRLTVDAIVRTTRTTRTTR